MTKCSAGEINTQSLNLNSEIKEILAILTKMYNAACLYLDYRGMAHICDIEI